jgi:hypothetical protein
MLDLNPGLRAVRRPDGCLPLEEQVPWVHLAAREPSALLQQVHDLLTPAAAPAW